MMYSLFKRCSRALFLSTIVWLLQACSGPLEKSTYIDWVQSYENGLHIRQAVNDYIFDVQYKPVEYVALQRLEGPFSTHQFQQMKKELGGLQYYTLTVSLKKGQVGFLSDHNLEEKQRILYYFSYLFQDDLHLEEQGRKLSCRLYHFERSYNLKKGFTFVLGFENPNLESNSSQLVITSDLLNIDPVNIKLSKQNIPSLKI